MLGALSLVGLLIKNAIVLIEEIDQQIASGKHGVGAILDSGVSRMRPVVLAATTTILGLIPLLPDVFHTHYSYCYRCPVNRKPESCDVQCLDLLTVHPALKPARFFYEHLFRGAATQRHNEKY